jgi:hypothetical protein
VTMPDFDPDLLGGALLVWAPETAGGVADVDDLFADGWVGNGRATYVTPRAGRYAFGLLAFDEGGDGAYTLRTSWLPRATALGPQYSTFYPHRDGYRDSVELRFRPDQRLARARVDVFAANGRRVWAKRVGTVGACALGKVRFTGRSSRGARLRAGRYSFSVTMVAPSGLHATTVRKRFSLSWRRLAARTGQRTVSPNATLDDTFIGDCSAAVTPAVSAWRGSIGYYSNWYYPSCWISSLSDAVATYHRINLPPAARYGTIRVSAYGGEAVRGYGDYAGLFYRRPDGSSYGRPALLRAAQGSYGLPGASPSLLGGGRTLYWSVLAIDGSFYRVKSFTIRWRYYVLR